MLCNPFGVTDFIVYATQGALVYVSNGEVDEVLIYNGANGSFLQKFLTPGLGGLDDPKGLLFDRDGSLLVVNNGDHSVRRFGASSQAAFTVSLSAPDAMPVTLDYSTTNGTAVAGSDFVAVSGRLTFAPGETTRTLLVRTLDDTVVEPTETFSVNLSNPVGATIADGQGVATIFDIATKFYVVNDATVNQTYEYASGGVLVESYNLGTGNTAPRGAASNAAGTTVWVVDANKKVYVYNPSGGLVGSWTAGSLQSNAQVEGVATNGTDVWLVDNKTDKVFKYTGAASRLSGSQNAASSFSLNSGNRNPKDIVTDGVSLWVVNDSTTDKVFKYTLAGTLVGSWTISTSGAGSPTGITIDPTNVSDIWIVDAFADKVFQYTAAASRSSGSQSAATSFALAAGNTNPPRHRRSADATSGRCDARASGPRVPRDRIDARGGGGLLLEHRTQPTGPTPSGVARRQLPRVTRRSGSVARDDEGSQTQPAMTEFSTVPYRVVHGRSVVVREYTRWPVRTAHAAPAGATVNSQGCKPLDTES